MKGTDIVCRYERVLF